MIALRKVTDAVAGAQIRHRMRQVAARPMARDGAAGAPRSDLQGEHRTGVLRYALTARRGEHDRGGTFRKGFVMRLEASSLVSAAALAVVACLGAVAPAAADPPVVTDIHRGPGPAPFLTNACGFPVASEVIGTSRVFAPPEGSYETYREQLHVTGTFTGPTGHTLRVTTNQVIMHRVLPDGTSVEVLTGRISLFQSGRVVTDLATGESLVTVGHPTPVSQYCADLAP